MFSFGKKSLEKRSQLHSDLQKVVDEAIKHIDFSIICGHRGEEEQNEAFKSGASKLVYPNSKHNMEPSDAFDATPYPCDWSDIPSFQRLADIIKQAAETTGVKIIWGGDWKTFKDYPHFELA